MMRGLVLVDRYQLHERVGGGGMGTVYRATDLRTDGPVAVKVFHDFVQGDPEDLERLRREARAAAAISSPRVVRVIDFHQHQGIPFLVMEYVHGPTLRD